MLRRYNFKDAPVESMRHLIESRGYAGEVSIYNTGAQLSEIVRDQEFARRIEKMSILGAVPSTSSLAVFSNLRRLLLCCPDEITAGDSTLK